MATTDVAKDLGTSALNLSSNYASDLHPKMDTQPEMPSPRPVVYSAGSFKSAEEWTGIDEDENDDTTSQESSSSSNEENREFSMTKYKPPDALRKLDDTTSSETLISLVKASIENVQAQVELEEEQQRQQRAEVRRARLKDETATDVAAAISALSLEVVAGSVNEVVPEGLGRQTVRTNAHAVSLPAPANSEDNESTAVAPASIIHHRPAQPRSRKRDILRTILHRSKDKINKYRDPGRSSTENLNHQSPVKSIRRHTRKAFHWERKPVLVSFSSLSFAFSCTNQPSSTVRACPASTISTELTSSG